MRVETCSTTFSKQQRDIFFHCFQLHKEAHDTSLIGFLIRMPMSEIWQGGYPTASSAIRPCRLVIEWSPSSIGFRIYLTAGTKATERETVVGSGWSSSGGREGEN